MRGRRKTYNEDDISWVLSQQGSHSHISRLSRNRKPELSEGIIKRIRSKHGSRATRSVDRENLDIEDEIIVQGPSVSLDSGAISGVEALQQPRRSTPTVMNRKSTARPEEADDHSSLIVLSSRRKRKRPARFSDAPSSRPSTDETIKNQQILNSVNALESATAKSTHVEAMNRLRGSHLLNAAAMDGLVELFGGFDIQIYPSDEFRSHRQIEISEATRISGIPLHINEKTWVVVIIDSTTGNFRYYNPVSPQWTEEIVEAMKGLTSRVINVRLKLPEEVSCAKPLNESDGGIHAVVNLIGEIVGIPVPKHIDCSWWASTLLRILECQVPASKRLSNEASNDDAVDCEDNWVFSQGVLQSCPAAKTLLKEQLTEAQRAVRRALNDWTASCRRDREDVTQVNQLQKAQEDWKVQIHELSEELGTMEQLVRITEKLGHNQHLVNVEDTKAKAEVLREKMTSTEGSSQETEEQLVQLAENMSARKQALTSLRKDVGRHIARFDMVTEAIHELSQIASVGNLRPAAFDRFPGPSYSDQPDHGKIQDPEDARLTSLDPQQQRQLSEMVPVLKEAQTVCALVGAGISTSAGIPDFRGKDGLFGQSGEELFHISVYQTPESTASFHEMLRNLSSKVQSAKPTPFHHMLGDLARDGRLLRLITQNIDGLENEVPLLATKVPLQPPYPIMIQLHGSIGWMTCTSCHQLDKFDPVLFNGPSLSLCAACSALKTDRMRNAKVGKMRPRFTLYEETGADESHLNKVLESDLKRRYNVFIVAGTALKGIPSVRRLVRNMRSCVDSMVWINKDPAPKIKGVTWDFTFEGPCDDVARNYMAL